MIRAVIVLSLAGLLTACEGGGDPVEQALRETAAAHQAAATRATAEIEATAPNPSAIDQIRVARMILHNEEAMATAETVLRESRDPRVRRMAQAVVDARTRETAEMKTWTPQD